MLGAKKLTVPVYKEQGATIDIALTLPGNLMPKSGAAGEPLGAVVSARFVDEKANEEYKITPIDDRTYQITATKPTARKRKSAILIALENDLVVATGALTVTPSKKLPSVKGTVNLVDGEGTIALTGGDATAIAVTKLPSWLAYDEETGRISLTGTFRKNKTMTLKVDIAGWTKPVTVKAKIVNKAAQLPKPTIDKNKVRLFANDKHSSATVTIQNAEVESITCANKRFAVTYLGDGQATISFKDEVVTKKAATLKLKVAVKGQDKPLTFKVKVIVAK